MLTIVLTSVLTSANNNQVQSAAFSCDGEVVVVGTVTGKWVVMDSRTKEVFGVHQVGTRDYRGPRDDTCVGRTEPSPSSASSSPPTAPSWPSPPARPYTCTGERCHVSRVESHLTRARVEEEYTCYTRTGRCLAQSSFLASLDWSEDSQYIQVRGHLWRVF